MNTTTLPEINIRRANDRGFADQGWLKATHRFSFADYYDPAHMRFRSLRVMNEDRVAPGKGFGTHRHRDMEIITYVISGQIEHKDSMGNGRIIQTSDFQYMSAGREVQRSEFNPSKTEPVHLYQVWIMPDEQNAEPRYAEKPMAGAADGALHLIASKSGRDGSIAIRQDANLFLGKPGTGGQADPHSPWWTQSVAASGLGRGDSERRRPQARRWRITESGWRREDRRRCQTLRAAL